LARRRTWTDEDLARAVEASKSWRQVSVSLGLAHGGNSYRMVQAAAQRLELDTSHFNGQGWNRGNGSGRDPEKQRAASRRWYENNRDVYAKRNARSRVERKEMVRRMKDVPCMDCGKKYPAFIMEFDHREDEIKDFNISSAVGWGAGKSRLMTEIAKCDVVCVLCHRFRTARRAGWEGSENTLTEEYSMFSNDC